MQKQQFSGQIKITVDPPELRTQMGGASKHHEYRIYGVDEIGQFDVWRRYSDFVTLKQHMVARWPGIFIPSLPEKKFLGNNQMMFVQQRRQGLQNFLVLVSQSKYLWYGDEFQLFIKSKSQEVDKFLANLGKPNNREIAAKFRTKFPQILDQSIQEKSTESNLKVNEFRNYLKNSQIVLQKLLKVSDLMAEARRRYNQKYQVLLSNTLPIYQQKCISEYTDDKQSLWFLNSKINGLAQCQMNLSKNSTKSSLSIVNQLIKQQLRQVINFQQILRNKEEFETGKLKAMAKVKDYQLQQSKINAGKQSILNKIKNASKQQQQQENKIQLSKARDDLKDAQQICKVIDRMLAAEQIAIFKQSRQKNYYKIIKDMAKIQKQNCDAEEQFWGKIVNQGFVQQPQIKMEPVKIQETKDSHSNNQQQKIKQDEHYEAMLQKVKEIDQQELHD